MHLLYPQQLNIHTSQQVRKRYACRILIRSTDRYYCVYIQLLSEEDLTMPREYQIEEAFISSIKREPSVRSAVTTADFVEELEQLLLPKLTYWLRQL